MISLSLADVSAIFLALRMLCSRSTRRAAIWGRIFTIFLLIVVVIVIIIVIVIVIVVVIVIVIVIIIVNFTVWSKLMYSPCY